MKIENSLNLKKSIEYLEILQELNSKQSKKTKIRTLPKGKRSLDKYYKRFEKKMKKAGYPKKERIKIIRNLKKDIKAPEDIFFSKYENKIYIDLLSKNLSLVSKAFQESNLEISKPLLIGTLPLPNINASVINSPYKHKIILFNEGLFFALNQFSKIIASSISIEYIKNITEYKFVENHYDIKNYIEQNSTIKRRFTELISLVKRNENSIKSQQYFVQFDKEPLSNALLRTSEIFIIAHEYAHIHLKHLDDIDAIESKNFKIEGIDKYNDDWKREIYADCIACDITLKINIENKNSLDIAFLGVDFFFAVIQLINTVKNYSGSSSHPPAYLRRNILRKVFIKDNHPELADKIFKFGDNFSFIFSFLLRSPNQIVKKKK